MDTARSVAKSVVAGLLVLILGHSVGPHDLLVTLVLALIVALAVLAWLERQRRGRATPATGPHSVVAKAEASRINMPNLRARGYDEVFEVKTSEVNAPDADVEGPAEAH